MLTFTVSGGPAGPTIIGEETNTEHYDNAGGKSLTVSGATVTGNLFTNLADGETLAVEDGILNQVFAGTKHTADGNGGTLNTDISGGTMTRVIAGEAVSGGTVNSNAAVLTLSGNLTPGAGKSAVWHYGAGVAANDGVLNVNQATVTVTSGAVGNVIGGGRTEQQGSVNVMSVNMNVSGGTVETIAAASYVNNGGSGTVGTAVMTLDSAAGTVFGGGVAVTAGNIRVLQSTVNLDANASVSNAVFGGSFVTGSAASSLVDSVTVNLDAAGSNAVAKGIYGGDFVTAGSGTVSLATINLNTGNFTGFVTAGGYASGGTSLVNTAVINIEAAATVDAYIYLGGFADGGNCTVTAARAVFNGAGSFTGSIFGYGFESNGGTSSVGSSYVTLDSYNGTFAGNLVGIDGLSITADSSAVLTGTCDSGLINVTGAAAETVSHDVFDLAESDFDIAKITVDGKGLQEVAEWDGLGFGYLASESKFAVVQFADKDQFAGYTFYTTLA